MFMPTEGRICGVKVDRGIWVLTLERRLGGEVDVQMMKKPTPRAAKGPASLPKPLMSLSRSESRVLDEFGKFVPSSSNALSILGNLLACLRPLRTKRVPRIWILLKAAVDQRDSDGERIPLLALRGINREVRQWSIPVRARRLDVCS